MQLFELQQQMRQGTIPKFMIFTGPEYKIKNLYIQQIAKVTNTVITEIEDYTAMITIGKASSLIKDKCLYVCRHNKSIVNMSKSWSSIHSKLGQNYLILILEDIDKRSKFYNEFKDKSIFDFDKQPLETVMLMLKDCGLHRSLLEYLVTNCECNYSLITNELDKVYQYQKATNMPLDVAFDKLVREALCFTKSSSIDELQELILTKDRRCFEVLKELKNNQESVIKIIGYLYNAFRQQLIVQSCYATPQSTGLPQFIINMCAKRSKFYSVDKLVKNTYLIKEVEQGIKNGKYEEDFGLDYLITELLY